MAVATVTLARRIARSGAPLTAVLSTGLSSRVPCCRSEREHPHGLCPTAAPRGVVWCPRVPPRLFSVHNRVHACHLTGSGSSVSPHDHSQRVRVVACLLVGVRVSRSPPPRVRVSPCHCTKVCRVPVPPMSPFCALQCPRIPPQCVTVSPCPPTVPMVSLCPSPCLLSPPCSPGVLFPRSSPQVWGQASRQPPGLLSTQSRAFSNKKILVELDTSSGVATMKFKSPPVNSLSLDFLTEFCISLEKLENDRACRGLIITSTIPSIFSSGLDIMEMSGKSTEHYAEFWRAVQEMWLRLYGSNMVTVAAINGSSPAGGCLIALSCDYRIMVENPKYVIGLNEAQLGIVAPFWFKDTFVNAVGHRVAERSLQLGLLHSVPEAHQIGLVDEVVPEEKLQDKAVAVVAQWLALPDHARQLTKSMMRKAVLDHMLAHREEDIQNFVNFISKDSIQKSLSMYMEMLKKKKS